MHLLEDKKPICGRTSDIPYAKAIRPEFNGTRYECPSGYAECIDGHIEHDPETTLCYDLDKPKVD